MPAGTPHRQKGVALPRFNITAEFDLVTEIEPEFYRNGFDSGAAEDFADNSYFQREEIRSSGGSLSFVIEATDEDEARDQASEIISDGNSIDDANGIAWEVESLSIEVEKVEVPMTLERAREILTGLVSSGDDEEVREAVEFIFDHVTAMSVQIADLVRKVGELRAAAPRPEGDTMGQE